MVALLDLELPVFLSFSADYIQVVGRFVPTTQHNCSEHTVYCGAPAIQFDIGPPPANHLLIKSKHLRGGFVGKFLVIFRTERLPQSSKYHQNKHFLNVIHVCSWPDQGKKYPDQEN